MRDHRRLICDTAAFMGCSYFTVFFLALTYKPKGEPRLSKDELRLAGDEASELCNQFVDSGETVNYVADFCLDVLTERIPIFDTKGKQVRRHHDQNRS